MGRRRGGGGAEGVQNFILKEIYNLLHRMSIIISVYVAPGHYVSITADDYRCCVSEWTDKAGGI